MSNDELAVRESSGLSWTVEGTTEAGFVSDLVPEVAAEMSWHALGSRGAVEDELDMINRAMRGMWDMEPDQVMSLISAISARLTEIGRHLFRLEGKREWRQLRTMEVDRLMAECDRQFKLHSRLVELRRQDLQSLHGA